MTIVDKKHFIDSPSKVHEHKLFYFNAGLKREAIVWLWNNCKIHKYPKTYKIPPRLISWVQKDRDSLKCPECGEIIAEGPVLYEYIKKDDSVVKEKIRDIVRGVGFVSLKVGKENLFEWTEKEINMYLKNLENNMRDTESGG